MCTCTNITFKSGLFLQIVPLEYRTSDNDDISDHTQNIRNLTQKEKTKQCRKQYLCVVEDRYLLCRSLGICFCDGQLSARSADTCQNQIEPLSSCHRLILHKKKRQCKRTGKQRKEHHDHRSPLSFFAELTDKGVCHTGSQTAQHADHRHNKLHIHRRFYNKYRPDKSDCDTDPLDDIRMLFEYHD